MAAELCARQGAQFTPLRRCVLGLVLDAETPATAYQLLDRIRVIRNGAAPPTIYRALDFLIEQGLIHKVERLNAFVGRGEMGQHHQRPVQFLICNECGAVTEINDHAISAALGQAARRIGFHPGRACVELDGTCARCWRGGS